jgi:hypothetical protein
MASTPAIPRRASLAAGLAVLPGEPSRRRRGFQESYIIEPIRLFPYVEFVHATRIEGLCDGPQLSMSDAASTLGPHVTVRCVCGHSRNLQQAVGRRGSENLPVCRGRHPHLQRFDSCGKPLQMIVLGASNLWFGGNRERSAPAAGADRRRPGRGALGHPRRSASPRGGPGDRRRDGRCAGCGVIRSRRYGHPSRSCARPVVQL